MKSHRKNPAVIKGTVIGLDWFYVVVHATFDGYVHCLCDNANNIYSFSLNEIKNEKDPIEWVVLTPDSFGEFDSFLGRLGEEYSYLRRRGLPWRVIAEVTLGQEDHRFNHWIGEEGK